MVKPTNNSNDKTNNNRKLYGKISDSTGIAGSVAQLADFTFTNTSKLSRGIVTWFPVVSIPFEVAEDGWGKGLFSGTISSGAGIVAGTVGFIGGGVAGGIIHPALAIPGAYVGAVGSAYLASSSADTWADKKYDEISSGINNLIDLNKSLSINTLNKYSKSKKEIQNKNLSDIDKYVQALETIEKEKNKIQQLSELGKIRDELIKKLKNTNNPKEINKIIEQLKKINERQDILTGKAAPVSQEGSKNRESSATTASGGSLYKEALKEAGYGDDYHNLIRNMNLDPTQRIITQGKNPPLPGNATTQQPASSQPSTTPNRTPNDQAIAQTLHPYIPPYSSTLNYSNQYYYREEEDTGYYYNEKTKTFETSAKSNNYTLVPVSPSNSNDSPVGEFLGSLITKLFKAIFSGW